MRFLRSKRLRNLLYLSQGGLCSICGQSLPDDWHADHVVPYSITRDTNIFDMQALCPPCNIQKGSEMPVENLTKPAWRSHQAAFADAVDHFSSGAGPQNVLVTACPGAGKSALPVIAAAKLIGQGMADRIVWLVPRVSLVDQGLDAFLKDWIKELIPHDLEVAAGDNNAALNLDRNSSGVVVTYNSVAAQPDLWRDYFARHRTILILDECHHVYEGSTWKAKVDALWDRAVFRVLMTGTPQRHGGEPLAYVPYRYRDTQNLEISESSPDWKFVKYGMETALHERSIVPLFVLTRDATAKYEDARGTLFECDDIGDNRRALQTALRTEFAEQLCSEAAHDFQQFKQRNGRGGLIVVCLDASQEPKRMKQILADYGLRVGVATSKQEGAARTIRKFKDGQLDAIVTCMMAYEGLDVPHATHLACLTHIRSHSFIRQMLARIWRVDPSVPYEQQRALAYAPRDQWMTEIIDGLQIIQAASAQVIEPTLFDLGSNGAGEQQEGRESADLITPLESMKTVGEVRSFGGEPLSEDQLRQIEEIEEAAKQSGEDVSREEIARLLRLQALARSMPSEGRSGRKTSRPMNLSERLESNRKRLDACVGTIAAAKAKNSIVSVGAWKKHINGVIKRKMRKGRENYGEPDYDTALDYVRRVYKKALEASDES